MSRPGPATRRARARRPALCLGGGLVLAASVTALAAAPAQWGDPKPGIARAEPAPAAPPASRSPWAAAALSLDQVSGVMASGARVAEAGWSATREVAQDLWPLGKPPSSVSAVALGLGPESAAARATGARGLRIAELPTLLSVDAELPLNDPATAAAGDTAPGAALSLQQAIELGVQHSLEVQAATARRESFEQSAIAARGALLPHLDARAALGTGRLDSVSPHDQRERKDGSLTLRQPVFDLPASREAQRQETLAQSAQLQWQAAVSTVGLQVSSAYLQALQARLTLALGADHERMLDELLGYVSRRAEAGGTSIAERDRVRARVANARAQQADARATLRASLRTLASLIGQSPQRLAIGVPASLAVPLNASDALGEARQANRELLAGRTEADAAALEARGQRARFLPRLEVELSHSRAINTSGTESYSRDNKALLVISWSLLNGGIDLAQGRAAAARSREKALLADDLVRKLDTDLEATYASLDAVAERYAALRDELVANRSVATAFQAQLVGGNRPLLDVLDAYQRLHQSRLDLTGLVITEVGNHAKVAHLTGRLALALAGSRP